MTQEELQDISSKKLGIIITSTKDEFCTFDGHSDEYVIEFKCRRTHYDTQLIEHKKYTANLDQADESGKEFLYIISTPEGEYVFNISKLKEEGYDFKWEDRRMPSKTDFGGKQYINKRVGYISTSVSS